MTIRKKTAANPTQTKSLRTRNNNSGTQNKGTGSSSKEAGKRRTPVATSAITSAKRKVKNASVNADGASMNSNGASIDATSATINAQFAFLQSQIALLQAQNAELSAEINTQITERRGILPKGIGNDATSAITNDEANTLSPNPYPLSPSSPKIGPPLATPVIDNVTPIGSRFMRVSWTPVTNAGGYVVRYSTDETFATDVNAVSVDDQTAAVTLNELLPNTTYYISVKTLGNGTSIDSPFSAAQSATTGISTSDETVLNLQSWLDGLQSVTRDFSAILPQIENTELNSTDRMRLNGSGVRRYGFIEKTLDVSGEYPQFWPAFGDGRDELTMMVREIEVLRNLLVWFRWGARVVQDLLLIAGDDAFRIAVSYYTTAREGAKRKNPEALQVFQMLQLFWKRRRSIVEEPTEHELLRDAKALLHGRKDGTITVSNESDSVVKGKKVIIDNTMPKPRGGVKVVERGEVSR